MKVLLAIDESAFSAEAVKDVRARLMLPDITVRVLHVVGTFIPPAAAVLDAKGSLEGTKEEVVKRYQDLVDGETKKLMDAGITAEGVVREGNPGKTIVKEAKEWDADLIVVGAHGLTGIESLIMGNVARHVVDHAPCSVEVVRPKSRR
jgi:nucleotide-binding universal stress UspA family protein